jgi:hypothetical protein
MTQNFDTYWSGTARPSKKLRPKQWRSEVWLVRRDTGELVETLESPGTTELSAMTKGLKLAKQAAVNRGVPSDWKTRKAPRGAMIV